MIDFTKKYQHLPGIMVEHKDGGMALRVNTATTRTESILILGTAADGPVMEPVAVDEETAFTLFGESVDGLGVSNGATLLKGFVQARNLGCTDIRLMRVTGKTAKARIASKNKQIKEVRRNEEFFATINGNDKTILTLSNENIDSETLKVYVKGIKLKDGYKLEGQKLTIEAGICDAGAPVTVQYAYTKPLFISDEMHTVSEDNVVVLKEVPKIETLLITKDRVEITSDKYTVKGQTITFKEEENLAGEIISVDYEAARGEIILVTENGGTDAPFLTATSNVSKLLADTPLDNKVKIYVNGILFNEDGAILVESEDENAEILHGGDFLDNDEEDGETVHGGSFDASKIAKIFAVKSNPSRVRITMNKKYFSLGDRITIEYLCEKVTMAKTEIELESYFGGTVYNQGNVIVQDIRSTENNNIIGKKITIAKPASKATNGFIVNEYSSLDYKTFGALVDAINNDPNNGVYKASTMFEEELTSDLVPTHMYFAEGEDGLNPTPQEMFEALSGRRDDDSLLLESGAFQLLEGYQVDMIVPTGVYADQVLLGKHDNFAYELALLCAVLTHRNKSTLGIIRTSPNRDTSLRGVQEYTDKLCSMNNLYFLKDLNGNIVKDSDGNAIDLGKFLSVVAGPEIEYVDSRTGRFWGDPAIDYAARNSILAPQSAPTNKQISGAKKLRFNFSGYQLDKITGNRIVTFKNRLNGNINDIVVVDGVTTAHPNSDYTRITTQRVMRYVGDEIRQAGEPYLGEPNTIEQRNSLASAISKRLSNCKENGVIVDYAFQIISDAKSQLLGEANIELSIIPPQELRKITAVMGLRASL